jgi:UDP-glucuronate decarboxylase
MVRLMNASHSFTGPVNVGSPNEVSILELAQLVIELAGSSSPLTFEDRPVDDPCQRRPDITLADRALNWHPTVTLEDGLMRTISYFRSTLSF